MCQTALCYSHFSDGKTEFVNDEQVDQCHEVNERHRSELKPDTQSLLASRVNESFITEHHVPDNYSFR